MNSYYKCILYKLIRNFSQIGVVIFSFLILLILQIFLIIFYHPFPTFMVMIPMLHYPIMLLIIMDMIPMLAKFIILESGRPKYFLFILDHNVCEVRVLSLLVVTRKQERLEGIVLFRVD